MRMKEFSKKALAMLIIGRKVKTSQVRNSVYGNTCFEKPLVK